MKIELEPEIKNELIRYLYIDVVIENKTHPLMIAVRHTTASLSECFKKNKRKIFYPKFQIKNFWGAYLLTIICLYPMCSPSTTLSIIL